MKIKWNEITPVSRMLSIIVCFGVFLVGFYLGLAYGETILEAITNEFYAVESVILHHPAPTMVKPAPVTPVRGK